MAEKKKEPEGEKPESAEVQAQKIKTNSQGYGYKYSDMTAVNEYVAEIGETYHQYVETVFNPVTGEPVDYIHTVRVSKDGKEKDIRGSRIVNATLSGKENPAQQWGSATTYARRYSLYMAYGLAVEDDDAESLTKGATPVKGQGAKYQGLSFQELDEILPTLGSVAELNKLWREQGFDKATGRRKEILLEKFGKRKEEIGG